MHKHIQAVPTCTADMHCINEAAKAQSSGQAELRKSRPAEQASTTLRKLGKRHKARDYFTEPETRSQSAPLYWCHDERPHSGTAPYTEWISAQPPSTGTTTQQSFKPPRTGNKPQCCLQLLLPSK